MTIGLLHNGLLDILPYSTWRMIIIMVHYIRIGEFTATAESIGGEPAVSLEWGLLKNSDRKELRDQPTFTGIRRPLSAAQPTLHFPQSEVCLRFIFSDFLFNNDTGTDLSFCREDGCRADSVGRELKRTL